MADIARLGLQRVEEQGAVERVEEVDPADRDGADRVAVVRHPQGHEARAFFAPLTPELERNLEGDLGGGAWRRGFRCEGLPEGGEQDGINRIGLGEFA